MLIMRAFWTWFNSSNYFALTKPSLIKSNSANPIDENAQQVPYGYWPLTD